MEGGPGRSSCCKGWAQDPQGRGRGNPRDQGGGAGEDIGRCTLMKGDSRGRPCLDVGEVLQLWGHWGDSCILQGIHNHLGSFQ